MFSNGSFPDGLLTVRDVARCLSISERTVWRWTALGVLPTPVHPRPRSTRWRAADIRHYLENLQPRPVMGEEQ
jgi:predicted DNA-binding transcriptional regulator AlpA